MCWMMRFKKAVLETESKVRLGVDSGEESQVYSLNGFAIQLDPWTSARGRCRALREIT